MTPKDPDAPPPERHPDQFTQGTYPPYDHVIHGPKGTDVGSLWIEVNFDTQSEPGKRLVVVASSWDLDDRQRAMIEAGGHVRLSMWTWPPPPVSVAVEGPFCDCHAEEMLFNEHDGGWYCRHQGEVGHATASSEDAEEQVRQDFSPAPDDEDDVEDRGSDV